MGALQQARDQPPARRALVEKAVATVTQAMEDAQQGVGRGVMMVCAQTLQLINASDLLKVV